ncbi:hypothetical protein D3C78_457310 [compost metagenome]
MHVIAAKNPFHEARAFGGLDQQIVLVANNGADRLKVCFTHHHVPPDAEALLVGRDKRFQLLTTLADYGFLQLYRGSHFSWVTDTSGNNRNDLDNRQICLIVFRQRNCSRQRCPLRNG